MQLINWIWFIGSHYGELALLAGLSYLVGLRLTRRLHFHSIWEEAGICISLGLGVIAYAVFALGLAGWLNPWALLIVLGVLLGSTIPVWRRLVQRLLGATRGQWLTVVGVGLLLALLAGSAFALPLYPPTYWDSIEYHLPVSKAYIKAHAVVLTPYLRYPVFTHLNHMLFTTALLIGDDILAQSIEWLMLLALVSSVIGFGRHHGSGRGGWWAAAILLANPMILLLGSVAYIDMSLTMFLSVALFSFWNWWRSDEGGWLVLAGAFFGLAAATKYPALFFLALAWILAVHRSLRARKWAAPFILAGISLLVAMPWYIRIYYYTGNPFFPMFGEVFGYGFWSKEDVQSLVRSASDTGIECSFKSFLLLPWAVMTQRPPFIYEGRITVVYVLCLPLLLWYIVKPGLIRYLAGMVFAYMLIWFVMGQDARYLLPILPLLSLAVALPLDRFISWLPVMRLGRIPSGLMSALGAVILIYPGWHYARDTFKARGPVPFTVTQRHEYLSRLPTYGAYGFLNETKGNGYGVYALFDENMAYYADGKFFGDWFGPARFAGILDKWHDGPALWRELKELGADHFLVNRNRAKMDLPAHLFTSPERNCFRLVYVNQNVFLFELKDQPLP